jgi:hypothetical protein
MRNFFIGLILSFEKSRNLQVDKVLKSKFFIEENTHVFTSSTTANTGNTGNQTNNQDNDSKNNKISSIVF